MTFGNVGETCSMGTEIVEGEFQFFFFRKIITLWEIFSYSESLFSINRNERKRM